MILKVDSSSSSKNRIAEYFFCQVIIVDRSTYVLSVAFERLNKIHTFSFAISAYNLLRAVHRKRKIYYRWEIGYIYKILYEFSAGKRGFITDWKKYLIWVTADTVFEFSA